MKYINPKHYGAKPNAPTVNLDRLEGFILTDNIIRFYGATDNAFRWEFDDHQDAWKAYERISIAVG